jgi:hypothetical protein
MDTAVIQLSSGYSIAIVYSRTFGEMDVALVLLVLTALYATRFTYDVVRQIWMLWGPRE